MTYPISFLSPKVLLQEPVLILAACLNHPSASKQDSGKPSVAAVVGTFDPWGSYSCEISIQKKDFFIQKMDVMMINLLRKFKKKKNIDASVGRPLRIIYYRYCIYVYIYYVYMSIYHLHRIVYMFSYCIISRQHSPILLLYLIDILCLLHVNDMSLSRRREIHFYA